MVKIEPGFGKQRHIVRLLSRGTPTLLLAPYHIPLFSLFFLVLAPA